MRRKFTLGVLAVSCLLALAGCGWEKTGDAGERMEYLNDMEEAVREIVPTEEYVPVAKFTMLPASETSSFHQDKCFYMNGEVFYLRDDIYEDAQMVELFGEMGHHFKQTIGLYAIAANGSDMPRELAKIDENRNILLFFADKKYLYLYGYNYEEGFYLKKLNAEGQEIWETTLGENKEDMYLLAGCTDEEGNIALVANDKESTSIFFLDSKGRLQGKPCNLGKFINPCHITNQIVCAGEKYYIWMIDWITDNCSLCLWEVDFRKATVSDKITINISSLEKMNSSSDCMLFSGGELGLLISTKDILWQYNPETGETTEVLRWDDKNICVDGRYVAQIDLGTANETGIAMDILVYEDYNTKENLYIDPMLASITYVDKTYLNQPQTITIGIKNNWGDIEKTIRRFNRLNKEYEAILMEYSPSDLKDRLMFGKEVPDLLDITGIGTEWLENKNLLEDLTFYFEKSENIRKEDILPTVWNLLEKNGKLTNIATSFTIQGLLTAAEISENEWDYDCFLELEKQHPKSWYFSKFNAAQVWGVISATGINNFIDWNECKCNFDNKEFMALLKKVKNLNYPREQSTLNGTTSEQMERLISQEILFQSAHYGSPYDYDKDQTDSNDALKCVGYPAADGDPVFLFSPSQNLAIYAKSPYKDGAWAFMEFLLSENEQSWHASEKDVFPVRESAFEKYLVKSYFSKNTYTTVITKEDTPDKIRFMTEHLRLNQNDMGEIGSIISEELQAYFMGDKTVEATTEIIQNRVQLYLDEM